MSLPPASIASNWLSEFATHLAVRSVSGAVSCFREDGWLRDVLIFTWDTRSLQGPSKIANYLHENLKSGSFSNFQLDQRPFLCPETGRLTPTLSGVSSGFTFDTPIARGQGYVRLVDDGSGHWKALTVLMAMEDLKGHEEHRYEVGMWGDHTVSWASIKQERARLIEENPHVLIVGAGQNGLMVAARFRQLGIPTLVVEKNSRVGDNWRQRYPTLSLHTIKSQHSFLYQPFPENWPLYTPRDKLAYWLEQYAENQDLVVWTNSKPLPTPTYDFSSNKWTVDIDRNGETVTIHPTHIILATGTLGAPRIPPIVNEARKRFKGRILHGCEYGAGHEFAGKRVVVVGSGNTSADICQDLTVHGAEATMVQRSTTCVISIQNTGLDQLMVWPLDVPISVSDFKLEAMPLLLLKKILAEVAKDGWQRIDREMIEGLRGRGLDINYGPDGTGNLFLVFEKLGGFWVDVGCSKLIIDGQVKVKPGVEIKDMIGDQVIFTDGSSVAADAVIFATGYESMRNTMRGTFGSETIDMTCTEWGLDEEGEFNGSYRPTGHPGLWFATGGFELGRSHSKYLALQIKAHQLGLRNSTRGKMKL